MKFSDTKLCSRGGGGDKRPVSVTRRYDDGSKKLNENCSFSIYKIASNVDFTQNKFLTFFILQFFCVAKTFLLWRLFCCKDHQNVSSLSQSLHYFWPTGSTEWKLLKKTSLLWRLSHFSSFSFVYLTSFYSHWIKRKRENIAGKLFGTFLVLISKPFFLACSDSFSNFSLRL